MMLKSRLFCSVFQHGTTPLIRASEGGHTDIARLLIDKGADVNSEDNNGTPLICASKGGHTDIARLLIDKGVDVNTEVGLELVVSCDLIDFLMFAYFCWTCQMVVYTR
eukprot:GHVR01083798.1.p1 GENE.GHVR01083798.1~~GHVR01083798.1.p1  ORF type:complete len:108 (-),score=7.71 GHVR01083798.1:148-471(-)